MDRLQDDDMLDALDGFAREVVSSVGDANDGLRTKLELPSWLDDYIFEELGAKYCRSNADMTVIDWDKADVLNYLGTYFPRSYVEAFCIFEDYFRRETGLLERERIAVFDFGSGTGGEIIGLLTILDEYREKFGKLREVEVTAFDGNFHALRLYESVLEQLKSRIGLTVRSRVIPVVVDDFYDLSVLESVLNGGYDLFISFKAICEFVTKRRFEEKNPYAHVAETFLPRLNDGGVMLLEDVSSCNKISCEWLPCMMDAGLTDSGCRVTERNSGYNQLFSVSHSRKRDDVTKVVWRIIQK